MKILLTGVIQSYVDKKTVAVMAANRKSKDGPVAEIFYLKFNTPEAYNEFKERTPVESGVQVIGLLRQVQTPLFDRQTKKPIQGTNGYDLIDALLAIEVKEYKPHPLEAGLDTCYAHGLLALVKKEEPRQSANGVTYIKFRVAYNHYKRPEEETGQGDFYNLIAFGGQAESLALLEKGDRFLLDYGTLANEAYEMKDLTHSDGTPLSRHSPEIALREFTFLPRAYKASHTSAMALNGAEELPF